ncbi:MAG: Txe/YoeB family addiction module toxin [Bacteroidia bacterium]|nr:Txe/YoeB family addiction module toxin [Bacteroidia bacterium]
MQVKLSPVAQEHLAFWQKSGNKAILAKIEKLVVAIAENPYTGIGKPEALKHDLTGKWSRRIDLPNRIVYMVKDDTIIIYALKGHYK